MRAARLAGGGTIAGPGRCGDAGGSRAEERHVSDMMYILAASYDDAEDAIAEFDSIVAAFKHVGQTRGFDAAVIAKDDDGHVQIVRKRDEPKRHATESGVGWGLATGAVAVLFPAVGIL